MKQITTPWLRVFLVVTVIFALFPIAVGGTDDYYYEPMLVLDPYQNVNWSSYSQHKANLHTHTTQSDGSLTPAAVIDAYHERDYGVLALTDHDTIGSRSPTWTWLDYDRNPEQLGMVAIQGNELSWKHHMGSYFCGVYSTSSSSIDQDLSAIGAAGGVAVFFHPGRYNSPANWSWYEPYFNKHKHLVGLEVYNQGDRYPNDRQLWDNLLTALMPARPVWGFSNDDMHRTTHLGRNWNTLLLSNLTASQVKSAMQSGQFYSTYQPGSQAAPVINSIKTDSTSITIEAAHYVEILWISEGKVIHQGKTFNFKATPGLGSYVRAEIQGAGGTTLTNPFGFTFKGKVTGVSLDKKSLTLTQGDPAHKLTATITPADALNKALSWSSSQPAVASVDNQGNVRALTPGTTTITVTTEDGGMTASCKVTVERLIIIPSSVELSVLELDMTIGQELQIRAAVYPDDADDKMLKWASSDPEIAKVAQSGHISALSAGTALITATTVSGAVSARCTVTVREIMPESITISATDLHLTIGEDATLTVEFEPADTTDKSIAWVSDNETVATVDDGTVTALSPGTAIISAATASGELVEICEVIVDPELLTLKEPLQYELSLGQNRIKIPDYIIRGDNLLSLSTGDISLLLPTSQLRTTIAGLRVTELAALYTVPKSLSPPQERTVLSAGVFILTHNDHELNHFTDELTLTFSFDQAKGYKELSVYYYDPEFDQWHQLETSLDLEQGLAHAQVNHLSTYALLAQELPQSKRSYLVPVVVSALLLLSVGLHLYLKR